MKPRSVTRTVFASPVFWLSWGAWFAGLLSAAAGSEVGMLSALLATVGIATATHGVERWYVGPRRRQKVIISFCANCKTVSGRVAWIEGSREFGGRP